MPNETVKIVYVGPCPAVEVPSLNLVADRDEPITVPHDAAEQLLAQSVWEKAGTKPAKTAAPAAEKE